MARNGCQGWPVSQSLLRRDTHPAPLSRAGWAGATITLFPAGAVPDLARRSRIG